MVSRSSLFACACVTHLTLATAGVIAFLAAAASLQWDISKGEPIRIANVARYNDRVAAWSDGGGARNFRGLTVSISGPAGTATLSQTTVPDVPAVPARPDVNTYSDVAYYVGDAAAALFPNSSTTWLGVPSNVSFTVTVGSASTTVTVPVAFLTYFAPSCKADSTILVTQDCTCPYGSVNNGLCGAFAILSSLCVAVDVSGNQVSLAVDANTGGGCAAQPRPTGSFISIPQTSTCAPMSMQNVGIGGYTLQGSTTAFILFARLPVMVRSGGDPWVSAAYGTYGSWDFDVPYTGKRATATALWAMFGVCVVALLLLVCCTQPALSGMVRGIPYFGDLNETFGSALSISFKSLVGLVITLLFLSFTGYIVIAFMLFGRSWMCASQSTCGGGPDTPVACGTFGMLRDSSPFGATVSNVLIAALACAVGPTVLILGCASLMARGGGGGDVGSGLVAIACALYTVAFPLSVALLISGSVYFAARQTDIAAGFCQYITNRVAQADTCTPVTMTALLFLADAVMGIIPLAAAMLGVAVWAISKYVLRERGAPRARARPQRSGAPVGEPVAVGEIRLVAEDA